MSLTETSAPIGRPRRSSAAAVARVAGSPRFAVCLGSALAAVLINHLLGKGMMGGTLNYHLYAGFSALHDRFGQDYFAAGSQSYFNPYIYVPFYLLATSSISALVASSILAVAQSAILWPTFELAMEVAPLEAPKRGALAICAVLLALRNLILIGQFGSSYADIITAGLRGRLDSLVDRVRQWSLLHLDGVRRRGHCDHTAVPAVPGASAMAQRLSLPLPDTGYLVSCHVVADTRDRSATIAAEQMADIVFDRIEQACPRLFLPAHQLTRNYSGRRARVWVRQYPGTGLDIFIGPGGVEVSDFVRGGAPDYLGRESDWLRGPPSLVCQRIDQRYYANVQQAKGGTK